LEVDIDNNHLSFQVFVLKGHVTDDPTNFLAKNWNTSSTVCHWTGVSCDVRSYRVTTLNISGLSLTSTIPSELGNLSSLQTLDLSFNWFSGSIPSSIFNMSSLLSIYFNNNTLFGEIPEELGNLAELETLWLQNNFLTGTIHSSIFNLSSLSDLDLSHNNLTDVQIPNLENLLLWGNNFSGAIPHFIFNASKLSILELQKNSFFDLIPNTFGNLINLKRLNLYDNYLTSSTPELSFLYSLSNCKYLEQSSQSLEVFSMFNCNISGGILEEISNLTNLTAIYLAGNKLNGSIPITLCKLQKLQLLSFVDNKLEGPIPYEFCRLASLYELDLSGNKLSGSIPTCFGNQTSLRILSLDSNKLISIIPSTLWNLKDILYLNLSSNFFISPLPLEIGNLKVLVGIDLSMNNFSGFGSIYKARIQDGMKVAVKVFDLQYERAFKSFDVACDMMKKLVLEYMPHGSLEKCLYSSNYILDIFQRLNIMIDVALALEYLHFGYSTPIIHCDLKLSNVLLGNNMVAHLSDFGMAKLLLKEDQSFTQNTNTCHHRIYGTRRNPQMNFFSGEMTLKSWVNDLLPISVMEVVDVNLLSMEDKYFTTKKQCLSFVFNLAMECTAESPKQRINAKESVTRLLKIRDLLLKNVKRR
ncbi:hypothetical protein CISIN_1g041082mg, partial [Citrus sinensis]